MARDYFRSFTHISWSVLTNSEDGTYHFPHFIVINESKDILCLAWGFLMSCSGSFPLWRVLLYICDRLFSGSKDDFSYIALNAKPQHDDGCFCWKFTGFKHIRQKKIRGPSRYDSRHGHLRLRVGGREAKEGQLCVDQIRNDFGSSTRSVMVWPCKAYWLWGLQGSLQEVNLTYMRMVDTQVGE